MPTSRRWTSETYTKRVDHEAGKHRSPKAPKGPRVCERCGATYENRRWTLTPPPAAGLRTVAAPATTVCPACHMMAEGQFGGEVRLAGAFVARHGDEIERLLQNEADRAAEDNPTGRIAEWRRMAPDRLTLTTTTEHLAKRLGQALHKAFDGLVHYEFSHENKFAHVTWTRED